jgi:hypothetical protein
VRLRARAEAGQALIETIMLGLLMLVPLVWTLGVLAELHRGALAVTSAAREAGFDAAHSSAPPAAARAVDDAVRHAIADQGLDPRRARATWSVGAFTRGQAVEVRVAYPVAVLQAPVLGSVGGPVIWVRATHIARLDPFGSRP